MAEIKVLGTRDAAEYLGLTVRTLKYHMHKAHDLKPDMLIGGSALFYPATLDAFMAQRRAPGRPRSKDEADALDPMAQPVSGELVPA